MAFDATTNTLTYWLNGTKLGMSVKDKAPGSGGGEAVQATHWMIFGPALAALISCT